MPEKKQPKGQPASKITMPSAEEVQRALAGVENMDDFFGKDGVFARLFGETLTQMMQGELTAQLGYEPYEAKGRNSGNSRNGSYPKTVRTSNGEVEVQVPRDRNGDYEPQILKMYQTSSNELEDKIVAMYAKGMTTRDIEDHLRDMYGVEASAATISTITNKVMPLVEEWQNRPLAALLSTTVVEGFIRAFRASGWIEHAQAQQIELGATIHLAFDELQPIDLPLRLPIAPNLRESSAYRSLIVLKTSDEFSQRCTIASQRPLHPVTQSILLLFSYYGGELLE
jgi:hypothetical protein